MWSKCSALTMLMWLKGDLDFEGRRSRRSAGVPSGSRRSEMLCRVGVARLCQAESRMSDCLQSIRRREAAIALTSGTTAGVSLARHGECGGVSFIQNNTFRILSQMIRQVGVSSDGSSRQSIHASEIGARVRVAKRSHKRERVELSG